MKWTADSPLLVCLMKVPGQEGALPLYPRERMEDMLRVTHPGLRSQKYWAWKTLEKALWLAYGQGMDQFTFRKMESGKWISPEVYFSLSHAGDRVCAAVSTMPVGVDLEPLAAAENPSWIQMMGKMREKIATAEEKRLYGLSTPTELLWLWTRKESVFKRGNEPFFSPGQIDTTSDVDTLLVDEEYLLSLCGEHRRNAGFFRLTENGAEPISPENWKP